MDARSLLRAKKAEARIDHPYAAYNAAGVLRCSICAIPVKQWDAHLLTKQHRQSVAREKAIQAKQHQKRSAPEAEIDETASKRARTQTEEDEEEESGISTLPAGFFSDGNRPSVADPPESTGQTKAEPTGDQELDDFLASLEEDQPTVVSAPAQPTAHKKGYVSSSTAAIPTVASYEAPAQLVRNKTGDEEDGGKVAEVEETEEERRTRMAREEREEIMARLDEEERAQEDADSRVIALKARMEALKRRKEARKGGKDAEGAAKTVVSNGA